MKDQRLVQTYADVLAIPPGWRAHIVMRSGFAIMIAITANGFVATYLGETACILMAPLIEECACWTMSVDEAPYGHVRWAFGTLEFLGSFPDHGLIRLAPWLNMWMASRPHSLGQGIFEHFCWNLTCVLLEHVPLGGLLILPGYYATRRGFGVIGNLILNYCEDHEIGFPSFGRLINPDPVEEGSGPAMVIDPPLILDEESEEEDDLVFRPQMSVTTVFDNIPGFLNLEEETKTKFLAWFEYVALLVRDIRGAHTNEAILRAIVHFVGHMTGKAVGVRLYSLLAQFWGLKDVFLPQSDESPDESMFGVFLRQARTRLEDLRGIGKSLFSKQIQRLLVFLATFGFVDQAKLEFTCERFKIMEFKTIELGLGEGPSYLYNIADTILWLSECGYQIFHGDFSGVYFAGDEYEKMRQNYLKCKEIFRDKAAFGVSKYLTLLRQTIDMGAKYSRRDPIIDRWTVELIDILTGIKTKSKAVERRPLPWSVLLHGTPGIAKTRLAHLIFKLYSCIDEEVEYGDGSVYVRNPTAARFDGFQIGTPFCLFDDVGFLNPACKITDTQTTEIIQAINDVPWVPEQAALEDKGTVPFRCKAVLATTNVKELNAYQYYRTPLAALRRFPIVLNVRLKPQVQNAEGVVRRDTPQATDDLWLITVERVHVNEPRNVYHVVEHEGTALRDVPFSKVVPFLVEHIRAHLEAEVARNSRDDLLATYTLCPHSMLSYQCDTCSEYDREDVPENPLPPPPKPSYFTLRDRLGVTSAERDGLEVVCKKEVFTPQGFFDDMMFCPHLKGESWTFRVMAWTFVRVRQFFGYDVPDLVVRLTSWTPFYLRMRVLGYATRLKLCDITTSLAEKERAWRTWALAQRERYAPQPRNLMWIGVGLAVVLPAAYMWRFYDKQYFDAQGAVSSKSVDVVTELATIEEEPEVGPFKTPETKNEEENPWKQVKQPSELPQPIARTANILQVMQKYEKNITTCRRTVGTKDYFVNAFPLGGSLYLIPMHFLNGAKSFTLSYLNFSREVPVFQGSYVKFGGYDLAMFNAINTPPRYDFAKFFTSTFPRARGKMVYKDRFDVVHEVKARDLTVVTDFEYANEYKMPNALTWRFDVPPRDGSCGAPLFVEGPHGGVCIAGIHTGASENLGLSIPINPDDIEGFKRMMCQAYARPQGKIEVSPPWHEIPLGPTHHKCPTHFMDAPDVLTFGSFKKTSSMDSRVEPTPGAKLLAKRDVVTNLTVPVMRGWFPWFDSLERCQKKPVFDNTALIDCANAYLTQILESDVDLSEICKITQDVAVNGVPGLKYVDSVNRSTSTGWPYNKRKCDGFLIDRPPDEIYQDAVDVDWRVQADIDRVWGCLAEGVRSSPIFVGSLKDEPIKEAKAKRPRVFMGCPLGFAIVARQLTLMFVRVFQLNPAVFEGAVGINAFSEQWGELYDRLTQFGVDRLFAGDYEKFDKTQIAFLLLLAFYVIAETCHASGNYTRKDYESIMIIGSDVANAFVNYNGNLLMFLGTLPSGFTLTVIINCIVNSIYMRYAWVKSGGELTAFSENVALTTYGDDNAANVSPKVDFFNHTVVQRVLGEAGVGYTMADKESESVPFLNIEDIDFLKRGFDRRVVKHGGRSKTWTFAPLDTKSIDKMLTIWVRSKHVSAEKQYADSVQSALFEAFQHGEKIFEVYRDHCKAVADECSLWVYLPRSVLFDYEYFMDVVVFKDPKDEALSRFDERHACKVESEVDFVFDTGCVMQRAAIPKCIQQ